MSHSSRWLHTHFLLTILTIAGGSPACSSVAFAEESGSEVRFNRDIRPILSNHCFACHGPDEGQRQTDLRFDEEASVFAAHDGVTAVVPGKPGDSELLARITSDDPEQHMPPPDFAKPLNPRQVELLKQWIEDGAKWEPHWAQVKPEKSAPPEPVAAWRPVNEIDRFVHARLQEAGAAPQPEADRRTLIRRLYLDLTGLPPTQAEVEAFVADASPEAYEQLVERLLKSPHFGERMAQWWLDLVRYADSIGYHSDNPREVWMYRDWVIEAFNQNMPFDRFTREQLAGEMLPDAGDDQKIASGYNRLLQTTQEGGAQAKEYIAKYDADRVRNVSEVWLGATMGCAECHDHKYDPYTQRDFYSLAAFFADINEPGVGGRQHTAIPSPSFKARLAEFDRQIAAAAEELERAAQSTELAGAQAQWEAATRKQLTDAARSDLVWIDDQNIPAGGQKNGDFNYIAKENGPVHHGAQSRRQSASGLVQHFVINASAALDVTAGSVFFAYIYLDPKNPPQQVMLQFNDGGWEHRAWWGEDKIPYGGVGSNGVNHKKLGPLPKPGEWVRLEVSAADVGLKPGAKLNGMAFTQWGGTAYWDAAGVNSQGVGLPQQLVEALQLDATARTPQQQEEISKHFREHASQLASARAKVDALKQQQAELSKQTPTTLITLTTSPRTLRMLPRGNWLDESGEIVQPATPGFLPPLNVEEGRRPTRLDLANWLVDPANPMTARAQVNRFWKLLFGYGLARTLNDLGGQGEWPTHPKLLDWLAVDFIESSWDVKHLLRELVLSRAYRQTSRPTPELRTRDPYNKLFARQSRFRLDAEFVRDNALSISGLLAPTVGGPSVKPYQPAGYWQHLNFPQRKWQADSGEGLYRRGLYTHWQRTFLHPSLLAFDATAREECTAERPRSNTPQQALVLLNDPTYIEAARAFAERIVNEGGQGVDQRIAWAFRTALSREPTPAEIQLLNKLHAGHLAQYQADPAAAKQLLAVGARPAPADADPAQSAAWTSVARVILNLHETITRY